MKQPTLKELKELGQNVMEQFEYINQGGCCVFAALVGKKLQEYFPVRIRASNNYHGYRIRDLNEIRPNLEDNTIWEWYNEGIDFNHVIIEFDYKGKTYHMDSTGVYKAGKRDPSFKYVLYKGYLTVEEAAELAKQKDWNPTFDRKLIPTLRKTVDNFFKGFTLVMKAGKSTKRARRLATI